MSPLSTIDALAAPNGRLKGSTIPLLVNLSEMMFQLSSRSVALRDFAKRDDVRALMHRYIVLAITTETGYVDDIPVSITNKGSGAIGIMQFTRIFYDDVKRLMKLAEINFDIRGLSHHSLATSVTRVVMVAYSVAIARCYQVFSATGRLPSEQGLYALHVVPAGLKKLTHFVHSGATLVAGSLLGKYVKYNPAAVKVIEGAKSYVE